MTAPVNWEGLFSPTPPLYALPDDVRPVTRKRADLDARPGVRWHGSVQAPMSQRARHRQSQPHRAIHAGVRTTSPNTIVPMRHCSFSVPRASAR